MNGANQRRTKGFASAVSVLIITAVTTAMMAAIGSTIITLVEETMPRENIPAIIMQEGREKRVELINPSMVSVNLSKLEVFIDSSRANIVDENGDRIWAPHEKIWFSIPDLDYALVEVYYDTKLIYKAVFLKPLPIYHDRAYPFISMTSNSISFSDDTALVAVNIYAGFENGESLVHSTTTADPLTVKQCYDAFKITNTWTCTALSNFSLSYSINAKQNSTEKTIMVNGANVAQGNIHYLRVVAYDATGKPSSLVIPTTANPLVFIENVTGGVKAERINDTLWRIRTNTTPVNTIIRATAVDDNGLKLINLTINNTQTCSVSGLSAACEKNL